MSTPEYIDIHAHLNDAQFATDEDEVISELKTRNIWTVTVGTDLVMSQKAIAIAKKIEGWATVGIHPNDNKNEKYDHSAYLALAKEKCVVGIGECGLDYYRLKEVSVEERIRQHELFEEQIRLAIEVEKPLMVHSRSAHEETIEILTRYKKEFADKLTGNIHFFTAGYDIAKKYFDLGFTVSFPGVITFASEYDETVKNSPLDMIMAETDSPYAAPVPHRGKRNTPLYINEIYEKIAAVRGEDKENVCEALNQNAIRVFSLRQ